MISRKNTQHTVQFLQNENELKSQSTLRITSSDGSLRHTGLEQEPSVIEHAHAVFPSASCAASVVLLYDVPHLNKVEVIHTQKTERCRIYFQMLRIFMTYTRVLSQGMEG